MKIILTSQEYVELDRIAALSGISLSEAISSMSDEDKEVIRVTNGVSLDNASGISLSKNICIEIDEKYHLDILNVLARYMPVIAPAIRTVINTLELISTDMQEIMGIWQRKLENMVKAKKVKETLEKAGLA